MNLINDYSYQNAEYKLEKKENVFKKLYNYARFNYYKFFSILPIIVPYSKWKIVFDLY